MVDMEMSEMATELNESMTSEDIAAYADAVAKEVAAERQGDGGHEHNQDSGQEPDASEQAEVKSGSKAAASDAQGEDTGEESSTPDWVSDELKAEVAAYGIDDSDLQEFSSREELDKFVRLLDKKSLEAGRKALAESDQGSARNEKGQFKKQEPEQGEKPSSSSNDDDRYEISLSKDLYDDEIVDEFTRMRDHYESRLINLGYGVVDGKIIQGHKFRKQQRTLMKPELYMVLIYLVQLHKYEDVGSINIMLIYRLHHPIQQLQQAKYLIRLLIYIMLDYKLFYLMK
jgi:hypothetical protein